MRSFNCSRIGSTSIGERVRTGRRTRRTQRFIRGSVTENSCSYCRRPDLTAKKFVPDPFSAVPGSRMYLTCDLARWGSDGQVEFGPD